MKKDILKYLLISIIFMGFLSSCEKKFETADISTLTYYPEFTMTGDNVVLHTLGDAFTDPGVVALENGENIEVTVSVVGEYSGYSGSTVDVTTPDRYVVTYSAVNGDGYAGSVERVVWVYESEDLSTGIAGLYTSGVVRDGTPRFTGLEYFLIWDNGSSYELSCAVGAYYYLNLMYGYDYAAQGATVTINDIATNDFTLTDGLFPVWGNAVFVTDFVVDAGAGTINYTGTGDWGSVFEVTLTKVQL